MTSNITDIQKNHTIIGLYICLPYLLRTIYSKYVSGKYVINLGTKLTNVCIDIKGTAIEPHAHVAPAHTT